MEMEPVNPLLRKTASPEIARFNGMSFHIYYNDHVPPHFSVRVGSSKAAPEYRFQLDSSLTPLPSRSGTLSNTYVSQIKDWFAMPVGTGKTVGNLMYEDWLLARNGKEPTKIPPPQELSKHNPKQAATPTCWFYAVEDVTPIRPFKLKIRFSSGECRIADVKAMRESNLMFSRIWDWDEFRRVRFTPDVVEWGRGLKALEIESQDLWAAGEPCN